MKQGRFLLLQLNDSLFPIGGYSHSYGLETYVQKNLVTDGETAKKYIEAYLRYNFCYTELLGVRLSYQAFCDGKLETLYFLDEMITATKTPVEIQGASVKLASRFIKLIERFSFEKDSKLLKQYLSDRDAGDFIHYSTIYGVICAYGEIDIDDCLETFLYAQTSAIITNCVKLIPLSQTLGQQILYGCHDLFREILEIVNKLTVDDYGLSTPGFDIRCMQHEGLYSRIYMS